MSRNPDNEKGFSIDTDAFDVFFTEFCIKKIPKERFPGSWNQQGKRL